MKFVLLLMPILLLNFQATTAGGGTYVVLSATSLDTHEGIQVTVPASPTAVNANNYLGFPTTLKRNALAL